MGTSNLTRELQLHEIRWTLEPGPAIDADEPIEELADIDLDHISSNPLAPSLIAVLRANRRLLHRLTHAAEIVKAAIELLHIRHREIERLERQVRVMRDERRQAS